MYARPSSPRFPSEMATVQFCGMDRNGGPFLDKNKMTIPADTPNAMVTSGLHATTFILLTIAGFVGGYLSANFVRWPRTKYAKGSISSIMQARGKRRK